MTILSKRQRLEIISNLLQIASDDILLEIFIRIPNCRSAILCSSVSQRCHSLISNPRFIPRFISQHHQHQARYPQPYTIIFRKCENAEFDSALDFQPLCKIFSDESMLLHGKSRNSSYLDFLLSPMVVRASCDDLLLLTPGSCCSSVFYICNPVTKKFYELPQNNWLCGGGLLIYVYGYALVRSPESECHFKVLLFHDPLQPFTGAPNTLHDVTIYCSKLGKWEWKSFKYPPPGKFGQNFWSDICMCNGILYWLEYEWHPERVLAFDLSRFKCAVVDFPDSSAWFGSRHVLVRQRIGTVGGELRLVQVALTKSRRCVDLRVWRLLNNSSSSWVLLHEKKYPRAPNKEKFVEFFLHPIDADKVFMVWGKHVFQYDLTRRKDTYELIAELQESSNKDELYPERLIAFSMVHPAWPTPLPSRSFSV